MIKGLHDEVYDAVVLGEPLISNNWYTVLALTYLISKKLFCPAISWFFGYFE